MLIGTDQNNEFTKLVDIINKFLKDYDTNEQNIQFVQSVTSSSENVMGRPDYWKGLMQVMQY